MGLLAILDRPRISDILFANLTPGSLFRLQRTCRLARHVVREYIPRAFDINEHLSRFFVDTVDFRSMQAFTGTVISGSNALQFLDRSFWPESDLDLYVYKDQAEIVGQWILNCAGMGYVYKPASWRKNQDETFQDATKSMKWRDYYDIDFEWDVRMDEFAREEYNITRAIGAVFSFESDTVFNNAGEKLKLQIIVGRQTPFNVILSFHSTVVLNVISWSHAYSFYPQATFEERRTLVLRTDTLKQENAIAKYRRRGWRACADIFDADRASPNSSFRLAERWADDAQSWVLPLNITGVVPPQSLSITTPSLQFDPVSLNSWRLGRRLKNIEGRRTRKEPYMDYCMLRPDILRYRYTAVPRFFKYMRDWFIEQGEYERTAQDQGELSVQTWWDCDLPHWKNAYIQNNIGQYADSEEE